MNKHELYYKKIENAKHHKLLESIKEHEINIKNIIELGCGSGRDTIFLLKERLYGFRD